MRKEVFLFEKPTEERLGEIKKLGINGIFVGHANLSPELIAQAKKIGLRVSAEVGLFAGDDLWGKYPGCRPKDRSGREVERIEWYGGVCPNHPDLRRDRLTTIERLVNNFDIDGVYLDFIRYPCHWELWEPDLTEYCFCDNCLSKFAKEVGGEPQGETWNDWKCRQITEFVAEVRKIIEKTGKTMELGLFAVPWRYDDLDGAIDRIICQNLKDLAQYIDVFAPMTFNTMCGKPTDWISDMVKYVAHETGKMVLPLVQTENKPIEVTVEAFEQSIEAAITPPSEGVIALFYEDLIKQPAKLAMMKKIFLEGGNNA